MIDTTQLHSGTQDIIDELRWMYVDEEDEDEEERFDAYVSVFRHFGLI